MKLRVGSVCLLTAFAIAAQATSALAADSRRGYDDRARDERSADRRYDDRRADDRRYDDRRYDDRRGGDRYDDGYYRGRSGRGAYPYTDAYYNEPQPERYCGMHKGRRAPAIMTYDQATGTQVLVDNNPNGVAVTGRNDAAGSAFAVKGDLSTPNVPYMCAADEQSGDAYVIDPDGQYDDAIVRGIDAGTGRRWEVNNARGAGPEVTTYDPYTGCVARVEPRPSGRPAVVTGYDDEHRRFESDFFAGSAVVLGAAAVGAAATGGGTAAVALGAGALGSAIAADAGRPC